MSWVPDLRPKRKGNDVYTLQSGETVSLPRRGMIRLAVKDSGAGMTEDQLASLFQDGAQFNVNELQAGQGSGLGLYISKGMAEQHGGSLTATSDGLGKGTTFTLTIPLYWTPPEEPEVPEFSSQAAPMTIAPNRTVADLENQLEPQDCANEEMDPPNIPTTPRRKEFCKGSSGELPRLRILVVDDVASNRKLIARLARNRKHLVEEAFDGQDAVDKVEAAMREEDESGYDVILMDYEMPRMNGPTAVHQIRKLGCEALIVGVTGNVLAEDVAHFVNNGANEVLPKPVKFAKLEQIWMESSLID
jgi:CheY-like chemotaxis protein